MGRAMPAIINETAKVSASGEKPISFEHSRVGKVTLSTAAKDRTIMYSINGAKKGKPYTGAIDLRAGGTVKAWYKENPELTTEMTYARIESVPLEVAVLFTGTGQRRCQEHGRRRCQLYLAHHVPDHPGQVSPLGRLRRR